MIPIRPTKSVASGHLLLAGDRSVWGVAHHWLYRLQAIRPTVVVDAAGRLSPYQLASLAKHHHLPPAPVLERVGVLRVLTVYQLIEAMLRLRELPKATPLVLMGVHALFADPDLEGDDAGFYHQRLRRALKVFTQENRSVVLVDKGPMRHRPTLLTQMAAQTEQVFWVRQHRTRSIPHGKNRTALFMGDRRLGGEVPGISPSLEKSRQIAF